PARRAPASGPGEGPAAHAASDAVLARVPAASRRRQRSDRAGRTALADRGMARVAVRAGTEDRRAGIGQAAGEGAGCARLRRRSAHAFHMHAVVAAGYVHQPVAHRRGFDLGRRVVRGHARYAIRADLLPDLTVGQRVFVAAAPAVKMPLDPGVDLLALALVGIEHRLAA